MIYASFSIIDVMLCNTGRSYCTGGSKKKPKIHLFRGALLAPLGWNMKLELLSSNSVLLNKLY